MEGKVPQQELPGERRLAYPVTGSFPLEERLKKRSDIRVVFEARKQVFCEGARLLWKQNGLPHNRIAFAFSRGFGCAARRNRARRLSREAYRYLRRRMKPGYDLVLLVYPFAGATGKEDVFSRLSQFERLVKRAGLFSLQQEPG